MTPMDTKASSVVDADYLCQTLAWLDRNLAENPTKAREQINLAMAHLVAALSQPAAPDHAGLVDQLRETAIGCDHMNEYGLRDLCNAAAEAIAALSRVQEPVAVKPLDMFRNCDGWGAAEWFDRLAKAIHEQDRAVVEGNELSVETYRNIAASSAMRLVRDYEQIVRSALATPPSQEGGE